MIDSLLAYSVSVAYEDKVGGILKKYGHKVQKLDKKSNQGRRPDFLVTDKSGQHVVVECKYLISGGVTKDGKHMSTLDPELPDSGMFEPNPTEKYNEVLIDARNQFIEYLKTVTGSKEIPFVVAVGADFFADWTSLIPQDFFGLDEISALIRIEKDVELKETLKKYSLEELERIIDKTLKIPQPPSSVRFKVFLNNNAKVKFKVEDFLRNPIIVKVR